MKNWSKNGNKTLLWHGTRGENLIGIMQTGFRIAPSDAMKTGSMFGEGVYFSDILNKSLQYSQTSNANQFGSIETKKLAKKYVFICEVALGNPLQLLNAQDVKGIPNSEHQSVMGYGRLGPDPKGHIYMPNGCAVPLGNLIDSPPLAKFGKETFGLQHNEYIVYDTSQIRIRYIIEFRDIQNMED